MSKKVLIQSPIWEAAEDYLWEHGCEIVRGSGTDKTALLRDIESCDAAVVKKASGYTFDREVIDHAPNLKLLARFGVGLEIIDVPYAESQGVVVTNSPHSNSNAVAEHTMYLILACTKNGLKLDKRMRDGAFNAGPPMFAMELEGKVLGLVGCGRIGSMVAKKAKHGFDMQVIGYDPHLPPERFSQDIERRETLEEVLREADVVSLHLPATPETCRSISSSKLALMKPTAFLINAARGEVVDEAALCNALETGVIAGAGLDVFEREPLPPDSPLYKLDNVVLTPHYAAFTRGALQKAAMDVVEDIVAVLEQQRPKYEVTHLGTSPRIH